MRIIVLISSHIAGQFTINSILGALDNHETKLTARHGDVVAMSGGKPVFRLIRTPGRVIETAFSFG